MLYQLSNIIIITKLSCVVGQGTIDGLVRVSDPKSQRKNVPTLTRTLNPKQEGWDYHSPATTMDTEPREELVWGQGRCGGREGCSLT